MKLTNSKTGQKKADFEKCRICLYEKFPAFHKWTKFPKNNSYPFVTNLTVIVLHLVFHSIVSTIFLLQMYGISAKQWLKISVNHNPENLIDIYNIVSMEK